MGRGIILHRGFTEEYPIGTYEVTHCEDQKECNECPFYAGCKIPEKVNPSRR